MAENTPEVSVAKLVERNTGLSVEIVNRTVQILNEQFTLTPKMYNPSDIYFHTGMRRETTSFPKINVTTNFVQIHFIHVPYCHYLVSRLANGQITIYDSISNNLDQYTESLFPQLKIIYESECLTNLVYKVPQLQGCDDLYLCGYFAIANVISLLNGEEPGRQPIDQNSMRRHLQKCLIDSKLCPFPLLGDTVQFKNKQAGQQKNNIQASDGNSSEVNLGSTLVVDQDRQPDKTDIDNLLKCCEEDWQFLSFLVSMPNDIVSLNNFLAKKNVLEHFAIVKEMIKRKEYPKFDVTLKDVLNRIYVLMCSNIDWKRLRNIVGSKDGFMTREEIVTIFETVQDFKILWAVFSMPHLGIAERLALFECTKVDVVGNELFKFNEEMGKIRSKNKNTTVEKDIFFKFLEHKVLLDLILKSLTARERIRKLSKKKVDVGRLKEMYGGVGVPEGMGHIVLQEIPTDDSDIVIIHEKFEYTLHNPKMIGECIQSSIGIGTTGWCLLCDGNNYSTTSLHIIFDSNKMENLLNKHGGFMDHDILNQSYNRLTCDILSNRSEVCKVIYKQGCSTDGGVEIALMRQLKINDRENTISESLKKQWKDLKIPTKLKFNGNYIAATELHLGMQVYKIGYKTGLTRGSISEMGVNIRCPMPNGDYKIQVDNQIAIKWTDNQPFSKPGDSGGPVFFLDDSGTMYAVGMVQSSQSDRGRSIITPVSTILEACEGFRLAPFEIFLEEKLPKPFCVVA